MCCAESSGGLARRQQSAQCLVVHTSMIADVRRDASDALLHLVVRHFDVTGGELDE